ncbi:MAG: LPS translocon maturation chaperone LptM [Parvularculaceae bacterium]
MRLVIAALAACLFLAACGKKAPLRAPSEPPPSDESRPS